MLVTPGGEFDRPASPGCGAMRASFRAWWWSIAPVVRGLDGGGGLEGRAQSGYGWHLMRTLTPVLVAAGVLASALSAEAALRLELVARGMESAVAFVPDPVVPDTAVVVLQDGLVRVIRGGVVQETRCSTSGRSSAAGANRAFRPGVSSRCGRIAAGLRELHRSIRPHGDRALHPPADDLLVVAPHRDSTCSGPTAAASSSSPTRITTAAISPSAPTALCTSDSATAVWANDPQNRAQSPVTLLGKMLRIDVSVAADDPRG